MAKQTFKTIHGNCYETPKWLFDVLNLEFNFTFDLACDETNNKCSNFYTEKENSLLQDWHQLSGWLWLNPPYSPIKPWIVKAQNENKLGAKIVILCPPLVTSGYFQQRLPSEIRFICGRVPFLLNKVEMRSNTSDSCLLIYDDKVRQPLINYVKRDELKNKFELNQFEWVPSNGTR